MQILNSLSLSLCIILTFEKRVFKESITKPKLIPRFYCYLSLYNFNILLRKRIFKEFLNLSLELEKILIAIIIISESLEGVVHQFVTWTKNSQKLRPAWRFRARIQVDPKPLEITRWNNGADEISSEEPAGEVCYRSPGREFRGGGGGGITFFRVLPAVISLSAALFRIVPF